jgi:hypothetical protein
MLAIGVSHWPWPSYIFIDLFRCSSLLSRCPLSAVPSPAKSAFKTRLVAFIHDAMHFSRTNSTSITPLDVQAELSRSSAPMQEINTTEEHIVQPFLYCLWSNLKWTLQHLATYRKTKCHKAALLEDDTVLHHLSEPCLRQWKHHLTLHGMVQESWHVACRLRQATLGVIQ